MRFLSDLGRYFASPVFKLTGRTQAFAGDGYPVLHVLLQLVAVALGVFAQPVLTHYRQTGQIEWDFSWGRLLIAFVIAAFVFPGAFKPATSSPQPPLVQFCVLFGSGIGWIAVFDAITKH